MRNGSKRRRLGRKRRYYKVIINQAEWTGIILYGANCTSRIYALSRPLCVPCELKGKLSDGELAEKL